MSAIRPEFPDPMLTRDEWLSLNGEWQFAFDPKARGEDEKWAERQSFPKKIVVPFCIESAASGIGKNTRAKNFWYMRRVSIPRNWRDRQTWLCIGASDYICIGYVNGRRIGSHEGGYTPIKWRIDPYLTEGENAICLQVVETTEGRLPRGKQTHLPFRYAVFYRPYSGIWQSVWLEARGRTHIARAHAVTEPNGKKFNFQVEIGGEICGTLKIDLIHPDGKEEVSIEMPIADRQMQIRLEPKRKALWSPETPNLYDVRYSILYGETVEDRASGYAGLRTIAVKNGKVLLNGAPLYQNLVLYQAYYPQGWATAIDDETLQRDVELAKAFGFNGMRIHQTIADPRLLYWCDKLGLLAWGEMPSAFVFSRVDRLAFQRMLEETILRDLGHPSLVTWVLFNETWGVLDLLWSTQTRRWIRHMIAHCRELDPSRPIIDNSGYDHLESDILDIHHYLTDPERIRALYKALAAPNEIGQEFWRNLYMLAPNRISKSPLAPSGQYKNEPVIISECGGHGFGPYGGKGLSLAESIAQVLSLIAEHHHIRGYCYTQLFDVEQERNGLADFDRKPKIEPAKIAAMITKIFARA